MRVKSIASTVCQDSIDARGIQDPGRAYSTAAYMVTYSGGRHTVSSFDALSRAAVERISVNRAFRSAESNASLTCLAISPASYRLLSFTKFQRFDLQTETPCSIEPVQWNPIIRNDNARSDTKVKRFAELGSDGCRSQSSVFGSADREHGIWCDAALISDQKIRLGVHSTHDCRDVGLRPQIMHRAGILSH